MGVASQLGEKGVNVGGPDGESSSLSPGRLMVLEGDEVRESITSRDTLGGGGRDGSLYSGTSK